MGKIIIKILKNIEKSPIKIFIGLVVFLISSFIIIFGGINSLIKFYDEKVNWKQKEYKLLSSLSADVDINYFESKFGRATFINVATKNQKKEYVFVTHNYYIDAITDENGKVLIYSVTIRQKDFNPISPDGKIILGKSRFTDLNKDGLWGEPIEIISLLGAHDVFYTEGYYGGNTMNYQTYYYSYSGAGYYDLNSTFVQNPPYLPDFILSVKPKKFSSLMDEIEPEYKKNKELDEFRKRNTNIINTYSVTAPFVTLGEMPEYFDERGRGGYYLGPDKNQVRLIP